MEGPMQAVMSNECTDTNRLKPLYSPVQQFSMSCSNSSSSINGSGSVSGKSGGSHVTLPPISSFDTLIRAAEKQYVNTHPVHSDLSLTGSPVLLSYQLTSPHGSSVAQRRLSSASSASSSGSTSSFPHHTAQQHTVESSLSPSEGHSPILLSPISKIGKGHKPRKKKECPICRNFYANLSTHKSTHLTPEDRPHKCPICNRGFARNNDLIRHKKRHWKDEIVSQSSKDGKVKEEDYKEDHHGDHEHCEMSEYDQLKSLHQIKGTFKCPYNSSLIQLDMEVYPYKSKPLNFETSNCHQTGVFSRCDTFKNHLKALHFEYPLGTKKKDRGVVSGRCKHCGLKFPNVEVWLNEHVGKTCGYTYH